MSRGPTVAEAPGVTSADAPAAAAPDAATVGGAAGPRVGVLALQGDVREHSRMLEHLGAQVMTVRRPAELAEVDGLVLPGGESTVQGKLLREEGLFAPLKSAVEGGMPVLATCAGLILLANKIEGGEAPHLQTLNVTVRRNAFGRQTESFETDLVVPALERPGADGPPVRAAFIRAPLIEEIGPTAELLAALPDGRAVAARQGRVLGLAFHPESTGETRFHELFLRVVAEG